MWLFSSEINLRKKKKERNRGSLNLDFYGFNFSKNWLYQKASNNSKAACVSRFSEKYRILFYWDIKDVVDAYDIHRPNTSLFHCANTRWIKRMKNLCQ